MFFCHRLFITLRTRPLQGKVLVSTTRTCVGIHISVKWQVRLALAPTRSLFHYCIHLNQHDTNPWNARCKNWREKKKEEKMWSKVITVKKGELLIPDHKRLDQPDRSKSISTYSLEKIMFLFHPKKQVRFDFTSTKILHVTQIFGEIHDSNAPVSRTFILYVVSLRLSFLFLLLDITAPQVRL